MRKVWVIATNSFRENIRDRILYNLLVFALIMIALSVFMVQLSTGEWQRITVDVGLSSISIFGSLMAIFLGISLVSKEIEKRTIYTVLAKPVSRSAFLLGKYLGLVITILVNISIMVVVYLVVIHILGMNFSWAQAQAIILIFFKLLIVVSIALFFSSFSTVTLSAIFTLSLFVLGHLTDEGKTFGEQSKKVLYKYATTVIYYLIPNLSNYSWLDSATYGIAMSPTDFGIRLGIAIITAGFFLALASIILERRDFV